MGGTKQILNKPKGRKKERQAVQKGSSQGKKKKEERKKERKKASKQARLSFCTDYNNKLQLRAWDLKRQTLIKFDPINFESKQQSWTIPGSYYCFSMGPPNPAATTPTPTPFQIFPLLQQLPFNLLLQHQWGRRDSQQPLLSKP